MGWTYTHRGRTPIKDFLKDRVNCDTHKVLDIAIINMRTAYMAVKLSDDQVVALVFLLDYRPKDDYDTGYKDMDETEGPYAYECPERILKLLTATENAYALEWRRKCWENIDKAARVRKLKAGDKIKTKPIKFTDGAVQEEFIVDTKKPLRLIGSNGWTYRVRRHTLQEVLL